ncbi:DUF3606 domain-containing protein [Pedobacter sp. GR22-6]|uniref:DUF3606 domain-containing protein n=1 Tax=Pedobacter sp. GR22-6 TaxID=3127957 RepID=UPI00307CF0B5
MKNPENFADAERINLDNDYELQHWTSQLKVTNDELKEAVAEVGNEIGAIKVFLNKS